MCELIEYWGWFFFLLLLSGCEERLWNENGIWIGSSLRSPSYSIRLNVKHTKKMEWNSWHMLFSLVFRLRSVFAMLSHSLLLQSVCVCVFFCIHLHSRVLAHFHHISNIFPLKNSTELLFSCEFWLSFTGSNSEFFSRFHSVPLEMPVLSCCCYSFSVLNVKWN